MVEPAVRHRAFESALRQLQEDGATLVFRNDEDFTATVCWRREINHLRHFLLTWFTLVWGVVRLIYSLRSKTRLQTVRVGESG